MANISRAQHRPLMPSFPAPSCLSQCAPPTRLDTFADSRTPVSLPGRGGDHYPSSGFPSANQSKPPPGEPATLACSYSGMNPVHWICFYPYAAWLPQYHYPGPGLPDPSIHAPDPIPTRPYSRSGLLPPTYYLFLLFTWALLV
ncbi:hypothetical protein CRV24_006476 [Beauveria bassiana]|nr:hypothetical protein CRV24_006476 [Beauveria bassiana]